MADFNFLVFPYRDLYFLKKFGPIVRDLHIIEALTLSDRVRAVHVVNRPVSVYERLLGKNFRSASTAVTLNARWIDKTSPDLFGPLTSRKWLTKCYSEYEKLEWLDDNCTNVILDFTPSSIINYKALGADFVWYDLIDNFTKHNRYSSTDKKNVSLKYNRISELANLVTGVTDQATRRFSSAVVVPNGVGHSRWKIQPTEESPYTEVADFGFLGFVTDKFDVSLIRKMCSMGFSVVVHGEVYDKRVARNLLEIKGVKLSGKFTSLQVPELMRTFRVGIAPYIRSKLHDESPLKIYQYLYYNHPVLTTERFEFNSSSITVCNPDDDESILLSANRSLSQFFDQKYRENIRNHISDDFFWNYKIGKILDHVQWRRSTS